MDIEQLVAGANLPRPRGIVLVMDTGFLIAYSNNQMWAMYQLSKAHKLASEKGLEWRWFAPKSVMAEYDWFYKNRHNASEKKHVEDGYGIILAQKPRSKLFGEHRWAGLQVSSDLAGKAGRRLVRARASGAPKRANRNRKAINTELADPEVVVTATGFAEQRFKVYVATKDFAVVGLINSRHKAFIEKGLHPVEAWPPLEIERKYLDGVIALPRYVVSGQVIRDLKSSQRSDYLMPFVIAENNVHSGDAVLNPLVATALLPQWEGASLPSYYQVPEGKYQLLPTVKIKSFNIAPERQRVVDVATKFKSENVIVMNAAKPLMLCAVTIRNGVMVSIEEILRADDDFLFHESDSVFAHENYVPVAQRAPPVSIPK